MKRLDRIVLWVGYIGILATMLIFALNVCSRKLGWPLPGTYSIITVTAVFLAAPSIIHVQIQRSHLVIESLTSRFSPMAINIMETIADIFGLVIWGIAGYLSLKYAAKMWAAKEYADPLNFPVAPFRLIWAIGLIIFCFVILIALLLKLRRRERN